MAATAATVEVVQASPAEGLLAKVVKAVVLEAVEAELALQEVKLLGVAGGHCKD